VFDDVYTLDLAATAYLTQVQTFEIGAAVEEEGSQERAPSDSADGGDDRDKEDKA
jgi:hypothetical protein